MKKLISSLLIAMMVVSAGATYANAVMAQPVLIAEQVTDMKEEKEAPFNVIVKKDVFELTIDENPTTGYEWVYTINKEEHVKFINSSYEAPNTTAVGAGGQKTLIFEVLEEGVSTITLNLERAWEKEAIETIEVLVYKNGEKLFVEEDQIVTIQDEGIIACELEKKPTELSDVKGYVNAEDKTIEMTLAPREIDGIMMLPLAETLRPLGYEVTWNSESNSVEINKGAQWTSITFGKNAYFKNKMAPKALSSMPKSVENRTFVPLEFFTEILDLGMGIEEGNITIREGMMAIHTGYVKELNYDETGTLSITLTRDMASEEIGDLTIIHTSKAFTYMNKKPIVGEIIHAITPPMMTMSLPGQTSAHVIY